jgi:hypothetical protein
MARPYPSGPRTFVISTAADELRLVVADAQEAYDGSAAFLDAAGDASSEILDESTGERLRLRPAERLVVRAGGRAGRAEDFLEVERAARCRTAAMLFFENGHAGLDRFGRWVADPAVHDLTPEEQGVARAAAIATESAAIEELGRIWADSGWMGGSDVQYYVFSADDADRAVVLALVERLGLERLETPEGEDPDDVCVALEPRLDAEVERWV